MYEVRMYVLSYSRVNDDNEIMKQILQIHLLSCSAAVQTAKLPFHPTCNPILDLGSQPRYPMLGRIPVAAVGLDQ